MLEVCGKVWLPFEERVRQKARPPTQCGGLGGLASSLVENGGGETDALLPLWGAILSVFPLPEPVFSARLGRTTRVGGRTAGSGARGPCAAGQLQASGTSAAARRCAARRPPRQCTRRIRLDSQLRVA